MTPESCAALAVGVLAEKNPDPQLESHYDTRANALAIELGFPQVQSEEELGGVDVLL